MCLYMVFIGEALELKKDICTVNIVHSCVPVYKMHKLTNFVRTAYYIALC